MNKTPIVFLVLAVLTVFLVSAIESPFEISNKDWGSTYFTISGKVNDAVNKPIIPLCDGKAIDMGGITTNVGSDGKFSLTIGYDQCAVGHLISFQCNGATSDPITVELGSGDGGKVYNDESGSGSTELVGVESLIVGGDQTSGVPEFSLLTMAIAVIGVGLGLAFLRKH